MLSLPKHLYHESKFNEAVEMLRLRGRQMKHDRLGGDVRVGSDYFAGASNNGKPAVAETAATAATGAAGFSVRLATVRL